MKRLPNSFPSNALSAALLATLIGMAVAVAPAIARTNPQTAAPPPAVRMMGTITAISGNTLTIKSDAGVESQVTLGEGTRMVRTAPGEKTLSGATPIKASDLEVGDRVLVRAAPGADAALLIAMKQTDIAQRQQQQREDWQKRGISGLIKSVDPATGSIVINAAAGPVARMLTIGTTPSTIIRQYAPDSVRYDEAKTSSLAELKPGDQLRARGDHSANGFTADEIVFGSFRNIAGTILGMDPSAQTLTVLDLATKKPVVIHMDPESQLHQLPSEMAQRIAMRLKAATPAAPSGTAAGGQQARPARPAQAALAEGSHAAPASQLASGQPMGLAQMLQQAPSITLKDLRKGEAVMVVAGNGNPDKISAITLLSGVEPLLQATPGGSESVFSASWSLGGGSQEAAADPQQ